MECVRQFWIEFAGRYALPDPAPDPVPAPAPENWFYIPVHFDVVWKLNHRYFACHHKAQKNFKFFPVQIEFSILSNPSVEGSLKLAENEKLHLKNPSAWQVLKMEEIISFAIAI